ncbi:MAG: HpcH/HpaI aldolase/citrate lyase family protein [Bacilli bacterium]
MKSLLFVPGNNPSMLQNSFVFESDKVIIDLEDAVSVDNKDAARILVKQYLKICDRLEDVVIRINGLDTPYYIDDMKMLSEFDIYAVMVPKVTVEVMNEFNSKYNYKTIPIVESCIAVTQINELVKFDNIIGILLGGEDLSSDLEVARTASSIEILYPRQQLAYYCKAYNKLAIDTPTTNATLMDVVYEDATFAKEIGMKAKACIHPNQVNVINTVFRVSEEEILWAKRVMIAVKKNEGKGAFSLDGKMIDEPIIKRAKRFLSESGIGGEDIE